MAEGWAKNLKGNELEVYSAGIETHGLNPNAVKVMAECGVDITSQKSQHIDEFKGKKIDYVITVCAHAHETCPWFPAECKVVHHGFGDPPKMAKEVEGEEAKLNCYRKVRDEIKEYVQSLPQSMRQE